MKKRRHRLHISKIVSIGAVAAADNEPSDIQVFKAAQDGHGSRRGSSFPPADRGRQAAEAVWKRLDDADEAITNITDSYRQMRREIGTMTMNKAEMMTAEGIADTVKKRAEAMRQQPQMWDKSEVELRAELWKRTPGLKDAYTAAMRDPDGFAKSKSGEHADALRIVKAWRDDPVAGL